MSEIKTLDIDLTNYLTNSLNTVKDDETLCKGWEYLKENITTELNEIIQQKEYWDCKYNNQKVDYILNKLNQTLPEDLKKQLGSFVYIYNEKRRDEQKKQEEKNILKQGYKKILHNQKEYHGKQVKAILKLSKVGLMGTFDKLGEKEGKLVWSDSYNTLILMPKRARTKGFLIRDFCFIKELN